MNRSRSVRRCMISLIAVGMASVVAMSNAVADSPELIRLNGALSQISGQAPIDGNYLFRVEIYDSAVGGTLLYSQDAYGSVKSGTYNLVLSPPTPGDLLAALTEAPRFFAVTILSDPNGTPINLALSPRSEIASVPFALTAAEFSWGGIQNRPVGLDDGDDTLSEAQVKEWALESTQASGAGTQVYQRDNLAPVTQPYEMGRYHMSITGAAYPFSSKRIPQDVIHSLCGDPDGCEIRLAQSDGSSTFIGSRGPFLFHYSMPDAHYRASALHTTAYDLNRTDGDANPEAIIEIWSTCYFLDYEIVNNVDGVDASVGLYLHLESSNPNQTCDLTMTD